MLCRYFVLILCWFLHVKIIHTKNFDEDYYFDDGGKALRSEFQACENTGFLFLCNQKCGRKNVCYNGRCLCYDSIPLIEFPVIKKKQQLFPPKEFTDLTRLKSRASIKEKRNYHKYLSQESEDFSALNIQFPQAEYQILPQSHEFVDITRIKTRAKPSLRTQESFPKKPVLRHHIAHFCPNLDEARVCITKCMSQGKPAFCGKDHNCYCGHKYAHTDKTENDSKAMYAEFYDLYAKYFGGSYGAPPVG